MASITLKGVPEKKPLSFKLKEKIQKEKSKKQNIASFFIKLSVELIKTVLGHYCYCQNYNKKILTLRNELTKVNIPEHLRVFFENKIFVSFPKDIAEGIAYDSKFIKVFIRDVILNAEFAMEEQNAITQKIAETCKKHFPDVVVSVEIKGANLNRGHAVMM